MQDADVRSLSPRQAALRLNLSLQSIYLALWFNRFPGARKVGRTWRIPETAVEEREKQREA